MKIRNMRWGYDGGGVACGPVSGSSVVEVCVTDENGHNFFVVVSQMDNIQRTGVSPLPLFDVLLHMMHYDVSFDEEFAKYGANVIEDYDYEIGDEPEEMSASRFAKAIHLARLAMQEYFTIGEADSEAAAAERFIKPYVGEDVDGMDLPELEEEIDEDEWEEE